MVRGFAGVAVLCLVVAPGCKGRTQEPDDAGWTPSSGTPEPKRRIGEDDCATWAAHGVAAALADWKAASARCPPEVQKTLADKIDGERATVDRAAVEVCSKHLGEEYAPADARCYMSASTAAALRACGFKPLASPEDTDLVLEIQNLQRTCAQQAAPPAPTAPGK